MKLLPTIGYFTPRAHLNGNKTSLIESTAGPIAKKFHKIFLLYFLYFNIFVSSIISAWKVTGQLIKQIYLRHNTIEPKCRVFIAWDRHLKKKTIF